MIKPTVGRVVWYRPGRHEAIPYRVGQPLAALVAGVNNDGEVNLTVSDVHGHTHSRPCVTLAQEGEAMDENYAYCEWMPYQKGQAAKTEAAERALAPHPEDAAQAANRTPVTEQFSFGNALGALKHGLNVARAGWNGKGMSLELQRPDAHSKMSLPYIFMTTVQGDRVPWLASQTDMLAEDWHLVT